MYQFQDIVSYTSHDILVNILVVWMKRFLCVYFRWYFQSKFHSAALFYEIAMLNVKKVNVLKPYKTIFKKDC